MVALCWLLSGPVSMSDEPSDPRQCELKQWCGPRSQLGLGRAGTCVPYTQWCVWWRKEWLFTAGMPACAAKVNSWSPISMPFHLCVHVCLFMCVGEPTTQFLPVERLCAEAHHRGAVGSGQYEVGGARCSVELSHPHILIHCYSIMYTACPCVAVYLVKNNSPSSLPAV